jgi:hypothetical protein
MAPDPWTAFVFFGIPFVLGLLGIVHSGRLFYRAYWHQYGATTNFGGVSQPAETSTLSRGQLLQYGILFAGSSLLVAHSGRWLLQIYGLL